MDLTLIKHIFLLRRQTNTKSSEGQLPQQARTNHQVDKPLLINTRVNIYESKKNNMFRIKKVENFMTFLLAKKQN